MVPRVRGGAPARRTASSEAVLPSRRTRPTSINSKATSNTLQISPRHLEAAATRSLQILYEGEYSGLLAFRTGILYHYGAIWRIFDRGSGFSVLMTGGCRRWSPGPMRKSCLDPQTYTMPAFVEQFDAAVEKALARQGPRSWSAAQIAVHARRCPRALVLAGHEPTIRSADRLDGRRPSERLRGLRAWS